MIPTVDLFAGAGGLSVGVSWAGADVRVLVELDPVACRTIRANPKHHAGTILEEDIRGLTGDGLRRLAGVSRRDPLLIVGGPPCQPFSKASYWTDPGDEARYRRARARGQRAKRPTVPIRPRPDSRRSLIQEFWRLVEESHAAAFLFENVPSILHPRNQPELKGLLRVADVAGFKAVVIRANAVEFGVPQRRFRVFVLGCRRDKPPAPAPTHSDGRSQELFRLPSVTAGEALVPFADPSYFEPEEVVEGRWAEHLKTIPPGWNYKAHTAWGGHPNPTFETETRFWHFLLKLHPDLPSWTIAANPGPWIGPFHWDSRRLRTVELAALQGFPSNYQFSGSRREQVRQIGNAVPPLLAQRMAEPLISALNGESGVSRNMRRP